MGHISPIGGALKIHNVCLIIILCLSKFACEKDTKTPNPPIEMRTDNAFKKIKEEHLQIVEIDGCEYVVFEHAAAGNRGYGFMSHKGNCKNPIHDQNACKKEK